jgi:hypothetical protein
MPQHGRYFFREGRRWRGSVPATVLSIALCSRLAVPPRCHAEERAPTAAAAPDVIKMKNGDLYRGTIEELVRGDHVLLLLPSGESRRLPMSDVRYAGPATGAPPESPPVEPKPDGAPSDVEVRFSANQPEVRLMLRVGAATARGYGGAGPVAVVANSYRDICTAPCVGSVPAGTQRLALSLGAGAPVEVDRTFSLTATKATMRGTYTSNSSTRAVGGVLLVAGIVGGAGLATLGVLQKHNSCDSFTGTCMDVASPNMGLVVAGMGILLAGSIAGLLIGRTSDGATLELDPAPHRPRPRAAPEAEPGDGSSQ